MPSVVPHFFDSSHQASSPHGGTRRRSTLGLTSGAVVLAVVTAGCSELGQDINIASNEVRVNVVGGSSMSIRFATTRFGGEGAGKRADDATISIYGKLQCAADVGTPRESRSHEIGVDNAGTFIPLDLQPHTGASEHRYTFSNVAKTLEDGESKSMNLAVRSHRDAVDQTKNSVPIEAVFTRVGDTFSIRVPGAEPRVTDLEKLEKEQTIKDCPLEIG